MNSISSTITMWNDEVFDIPIQNKSRRTPPKSGVQNNRLKGIKIY